MSSEKQVDSKSQKEIDLKAFELKFGHFVNEHIKDRYRNSWIHACEYKNHQLAEKDKEIESLLKQFRIHKDLNRKLANGNHDLSLKLKEAREVIKDFECSCHAYSGVWQECGKCKFLKENPEK